MRKYRKPYRIKKKKSIIKSRFFWFPILFLIIFGTIVYFFCFFKEFQIKNILVSSDFAYEKQDILNQKVKNFIEREITREILFFHSKSIFFIDKKEVKKNIFQVFPNISKIELKKRLPNTLIVEIKKREPVALFCIDTNCFLIDGNGVIFQNTESLNFLKTEGFFLKIKNPNSKKESKLGENVIEKEKLSKILEIKSKLDKDFNILILEVAIVSDERLNAKTDRGWQIYFNQKESISWQLTKLKFALEQKIPKEKREDLEYIDLRFGNMVYLKYQEVEESSIDVVDKD